MCLCVQPDSVQNQSRLNASEVTDGHHVSPEQVIRDRLLTKINRTNEQLISEQNAKQRMYCYYCYLLLPISRLGISGNTITYSDLFQLRNRERARFCSI